MILREKTLLTCQLPSCLRCSRPKLIILFIQQFVLEEKMLSFFISLKMMHPLDRKSIKSIDWETFLLIWLLNQSKNQLQRLFFHTKQMSILLTVKANLCYIERLQEKMHFLLNFWLITIQWLMRWIPLERKLLFMFFPLKLLMIPWQRLPRSY